MDLRWEFEQQLCCFTDAINADNHDDADDV